MPPTWVVFTVVLTFQCLLCCSCGADERWLAEALQVLGLEYSFWMKEGERAVTLVRRP